MEMMRRERESEKTFSACSIVHLIFEPKQGKMKRVRNARMAFVKELQYE